MKREHISFAVAGIIFGFLLGFVVAHEMYGGRFARMPGSGSAAGSSGTPMAGGGSPGAGSGGDSADAMNQVQRELAALKQAIQEDPRNVKALTRLGQLYSDAAMYEQSVEYFRQALEVEDDVHVRTDMAASLLMMGSAREALNELLAAVEKEPDHGQTWYWLGLAHVEVGEFDLGKEAFAKALELMPGSFDMDEITSEIEKVKARRASESSGSSPS